MGARDRTMDTGSVPPPGQGGDPEDGWADQGFRMGQSMGMAIKESCLVKGAVGVLGGYVMGLFMGMLFAPMEQNVADPAFQKQSLKQQAKSSLRDIGRRSNSFGKN